MAVDISKVFKANVKAIRMNSPDCQDKTELLNQELLKTRKNEKGFINDLKNIVNLIFYYILRL
jgi:hypothetical protein